MECCADVDRHKGSATWEWEAVEPMASYLATIDVGFWDVHVWETASGLPVYDAVDSAITGELRAVIDASLARQGEIIDMLSDAFGPYRSARPARSSTTRTTCSSPWKPRPDPSTPSTSGSTPKAIRPTVIRLSFTSLRTSGSATTLRSHGGRTSGSTRALPRTPSGSGPNTRARPRRSRSSRRPTRRSRPRIRSGRS